MKILRQIFLALAVVLTGTTTLRADTTIGTPIGATPYFISKPGKYRLAKTLVHNSTSPAITIGARDVVLDLNGFSITGKSDISDNNVCIVVGGSNVLIRNGTIRRFNIGISDNLATQGTIIEDVICFAQTSSAVVLTGNDNIVRRVVVRNTGSPLEEQPESVVGIRLNGRSVVEHCVIQNLSTRPDVSPVIGIRATGGSYVIRECDIHNVFNAGISTNADTSTIIENVRIRECRIGLEVTSFNGPPLLRDSTIRDCNVSASGGFTDGGRNNLE